MKSSHELSNELVELMKQKQIEQANRNKVKVAIKELRNELATIRIKINNLEIGDIQSEDNLNGFNVKIEEKKAEFWAAKNDGL